MSGILKTLRLAALPNKCFLQRSCNFCLTAMLFSLMLYWVQVTQAERDDLLANCTGKAVWMVSFSQSCHYFSFNKLPTPVAAGTIHALVIQGAKVFPILNEKASLCQVTATHWKKKKTTHWKNIPTKDVRNSLCCQQMRLPWWSCFSILDSCLHLHDMLWQHRRWLAFSGYKAPCNQKFIWRNLHSHNCHAFRPHQDLSYLVSSC